MRPPSDLDGPSLPTGPTDLYGAYWMGSSDGLFAVAVDPTRGFVFLGLNASHEQATGFLNVDIANKTPEECLPPEIARHVTERYQACLDGGAPVNYLESFDLPAGFRQWETSLVPVRDDSGTIRLLLGRARDVTSQQQVAAKAETVSTLLLDIMSAIQSHVAVLDEKGVVRMVNEAWRAFGQARGAPLGAYIGVNYLDVCRRAEAEGDASAGKVADELQAILEHRQASFMHIYHCAGLVFQMRASRFDHENTSWLVLAHDDVTEIRDAQRELSKATEQLMDVQEEERRRIGLELHDSTAQHLVAAQLAIAALAAESGSEDRYADVQQALTEAQKEIRALSYLLHPPRLAADGLERTLKTFAAGFAKRTGLEIQIEIAGNLHSMEFEVQRAVFRVVQEALANALRHGKATHVGIKVLRDRKGLHLEVADNGVGGHGASITPGVGIPGMQARIARCNGSLSVTLAEAGTMVVAFIPNIGLDPG